MVRTVLGWYTSETCINIETILDPFHYSQKGNDVVDNGQIWTNWIFTRRWTTTEQNVIHIVINFQAATTVLRMFNVLRLCHKSSAMKIVHHKNPPYLIIEERPLTGTNKAEKIWADHEVISQKFAPIFCIGAPPATNQHELASWRVDGRW